MANLSIQRLDCCAYRDGRAHPPAGPKIANGTLGRRRSTRAHLETFGSLSPR
jgi:hypothetical protein